MAKWNNLDCCQATLLSRAWPDIPCTARAQAPARFARRIPYFALVGSLRKPNLQACSQTIILLHVRFTQFEGVT